MIGLNLLTGKAGLISVGHGALMGIGAYVTAILVQHAGWSYLIAVPIAVASCAVIGAVLGFPALRIRGLYLGLVTLSVAIALSPVLKRWADLTGGPLGISPRPPDLLSDTLTPAQSVFLTVTAVAVGVAVLMRWAMSTGWGRRLAAVKVSDKMSAANGIPVASTKIGAFVAGSAIAGLGGALYVIVLGTITPDTFTVMLSITLLAAAVFGGLYTPIGAVIGAVFFVYVPDLTAGFGGQASQILYAAALLLAIYFAPAGMGGLLTQGLRVANTFFALQRSKARSEKS
ncbi:branched-chain amino acid ABC transporter permease [Nocardia sp. NPDC052278]|uniref:branched-chain amino acid ABC transporter permease n=1 Tax=unclassified Nocardia TaxID=2637762 RepID=UPI003675A5DC